MSIKKSKSEKIVPYPKRLSRISPSFYPYSDFPSSEAYSQPISDLPSFGYDPTREKQPHLHFDLSLISRERLNEGWAEWGWKWGETGIEMKLAKMRVINSDRNEIRVKWYALRTIENCKKDLLNAIRTGYENI